MASTQALVDAPPLPPLPSSLYIPPPVNRMDDILESEQPPRKRLCLSTLGSSEVVYGIRDTWVDPAEAVPEIAPTTLGEVNTRVTKLAELHEHDTQDLYALLEDAQDGLSQAVHHELQTYRDQVYAHETHIQAHQAHLQLQSTLIQTHHQVYETRSQIQQTEMAKLRDTDRRRKAELLALRGQQRARQPGPDARILDHQDAFGDADSHI
ncbi:hypothetical protein Tco_0718687 [Tanacetum coccineum]